MDQPILSYSLKAEDMVIDEAEVLRYLGYRKIDVTEADKEPVRDLCAKARNFIVAKSCYRRFPVKVYSDGRIDLPYGQIISHDLTRNLNGCDEIFIIAGTIGPMFDRALKSMHVVSMSQAAIWQAIGATAVEELIDSLNSHIKLEMAKEGRTIRHRYSPGFGDFKLDNQKGVFSVLEPYKYTGITLMDTLIMSPEKSVTAIIGIES